MYEERPCISCGQRWNGRYGSVCNQCKIIEQQKKQIEQQSQLNSVQSFSNKELYMPRSFYSSGTGMTSEEYREYVNSARYKKEMRGIAIRDFFQNLFMWSMILGILYIVFNPNIH